jgi:dehydrogenase/reductase SDR family protein 7B
MDKTTANGAEPDEVAVTILDKVAKGNIDFIVAATTSAKAAIWMRLLCPGILQKLLVKRFKKSEQEKEKID